MSERERSPVEPPAPDGPRAMDGVTGFIGLRWEDPQTVQLQIRPELINRGGLLSGVVTYAMVDYCMGSTLWAQTTEEERIATISISDQLHPDRDRGRDRLPHRTLDRRNRTIGSDANRGPRTSEGRLLVTAIGSYSIFPARGRPRVTPIPEGASAAAAG